MITGMTIVRIILVSGLKRVRPFFSGNSRHDDHLYAR